MIRISVYRDKCTLCGRCVDACPVGCFQMDSDGELRVINEELCLFCRNCVEEAPRKGCISVELLS